MSDALVIAELSEDGKVKKSTLSAVSFAQRALPALGGTFSILVLGANAKAAAAELAGYGAAKI
ncbi:MAG TPA: electron transfer flavoprotein subunit alpha/FixB family protein, partial [Polyangiaceae bacterium]